MKVFLLMATTLDGKIAKNSNELINWTGENDKKIFVKITKNAGAMIMGSKTYDTIGKVLPDRKNIVLTRDKKRVSDNKDLIFTDKKPSDLLNMLEKENYSKVILIGGATINTLFIKHKLIDEILLTITPLIFGKGLSLFNDYIDLKLELREVKKNGENSIFLRYKIL